MSWPEVAIVFSVTFIVTYIMVPLAMRIAKLLGAIDYPSNRRVNTVPIPRCGGIALYFGLISGVFTLFVGVRFFGWELNNLYVLSQINYIFLFLGVTAMFAVGLVDDITQLNAWVKFLWQVFAASIVVAAGVSIGTVRITLVDDFLDLGLLDYPISVLYLVIFVNIINLIDGLDGLASGVVAIISAGLLYLVTIRGNMTMSFMCVTLIAVCLAFLRFNFFPASIFMGDSGSMLLGLCLGTLSIAGVAHTQSMVLMVVPLAIAGVPVLDTFSAIVRRLRGHQSIGQGDLNHLHHRLMRSGLSQKRSVALLWACSAVLAIIGCIISVYSGTIRWIVFGILFIAVFVIIWRFGLFTSVLKHHYDNRGRVGPRVPRHGGVHNDNAR